MRTVLALPVAFFAGALLVGGGAARAENPPPAKGPVPLDVFFKGAVVGLDGKRVRLRYDFSTAEQWKDWLEFVPWAIAKEANDRAFLADGRLSVRGNGGAKHAADWEGDISVSCRLVPDGVKDIGAYLSTPDAATDFVSYTIVETYFHAWDKKAGGDTGMMKFAKQFSDIQRGGYNGFRYLSMRMLDTAPVPGKAIAFSFGRKGEKLFMNTDDLKQDSAEVGNRLKRLQPGFYAISSGATVDDVLIEGTLSPSWLERNQVALRTEKPIPEEEAAAPVDPAVTALLDAYKAGKAGASKLVEVVMDATRSEADRKASSDALKAGPRRALVAVIDLLYAPDPKARAAGIDVVKAMTGKNYGYDPKAGPKARGAAIDRLNEDIQKHPELLEGQGG